MERNVPVTTEERADRPAGEHAEEQVGEHQLEVAEAHHEAGEEPPEYRQDISVAFLPLALVTFLILAFGAAAWTILAAG